VVAAGKTDPGRVREPNEDFISLAPEHRLFLVADGMGGHASGNVASRLAAKSIRNFFDATEGEPFAEPPHPDDGDAPPEARRLASAIRKANRDIHEISTSQLQHKGMGSTVVAIHLVGSEIHIAHVGDSRCYRAREGELQQLTRDHSLHNEALALRPNLSAERLAKLPKNVVTRALGMSATVKVELRRETLEIGDLFLLCSDGLTGMVKDDDILGLVGLSDELKESCELLVAMANEAGGSDNISAVIVRVEEVPLPAVRAAAAAPASASASTSAPMSAPTSVPQDAGPELSVSDNRETLPEMTEEDLAAAGLLPDREAGAATPYGGPELRVAQVEFSTDNDELSLLAALEEAGEAGEAVAFEMTSELLAPRPLPEPSDEPLVPQPTIALLDASPDDELVVLERELLLEEAERAERHARAAPGLPRCRRCEAPILRDSDYCVDCGLLVE
jgi:protein phosphatase